MPLLRAAGVSLPGLCAGDARRVALEAYPGLLAREVLGSRSYKSDDKAKQTPERLIARKDLVDALEQGRTRLALPGLATFVFWGYQLFIVLAATGYLLGISQGKEYAEPEWYVDLWLTLVDRKSVV